MDVSEERIWISRALLLYKGDCSTKGITNYISIGPDKLYCSIPSHDLWKLWARFIRVKVVQKLKSKVVLCELSGLDQNVKWGRNDYFQPSYSAQARPAQ